MEMSSNDYQSNLKSLKATFEIEGMCISEESLVNLKKLADGEISCEALVEKIKQKYIKTL